MYQPTMQMPKSNLNIKTSIRHLLKAICGFDTRYILKIHSVNCLAHLFEVDKDQILLAVIASVKIDLI
jgi:hypothetical protein